MSNSMFDQMRQQQEQLRQQRERMRRQLRGQRGAEVRAQQELARRRWQDEVRRIHADWRRQQDA